MPASKQQKLNRIARQARVGEAYLSGRAQYLIAQDEGVDPSTITRDLEALHAGWLERHDLATGKKKARELARIDRVEREAWAAWDRSVGEVSKSSTKTKAIAQKYVEHPERGPELVSQSAIEKTVHTEQHAGDPRFLSVVQKCIDQRRAILGLDAPKETRVELNFTILSQHPDILAGIARGEAEALANAFLLSAAAGPVRN